MPCLGCANELSTTCKILCCSSVGQVSWLRLQKPYEAQLGGQTKLSSAASALHAESTKFNPHHLKVGEGMTPSVRCCPEVGTILQAEGHFAPLSRGQIPVLCCGEYGCAQTHTSLHPPGKQDHYHSLRTRPSMGQAAFKL